MPPEMLFIASEAGAAAYLVPLIRMLQAKGLDSWRLVATEVAELKFVDAGIRCDAQLPRDASLGQLVAALGAWRFGFALISATGAPLEAAAIRLSRERGARLVGFIDAFTPCLPRFRFGNELLFPDEILVVDQSMAEEAVKNGVPSDRLRVIGQPAWEGVEALPAASRKRALFVEQPVERCYGLTLGYTEHSAWQLVLECRQAAPRLLEALGYAVHPGLMMLHAEDGRTLPGADVAIETDASAALTGYGVVMGMFSSLLIEALLAERHVVSIQPGLPLDDMCVLSRHGLARRVGDAGALADALENLAPIPPPCGLRVAVSGSLSRLGRLLEAKA